MPKAALIPFACIAWIALLFAGCAKRESAADEGIRTKTLLLGNNAEPKDLDPQRITSATDMNIALALFEGLTVLDEKTATPRPAAADRWEITPDGLTYTFHLRAGARWSNGDPVTSRDFAYSFQRILTPAFAAEYSYMLWPLKNAEAFNTGKITDFSAVGVATPDDATLQLTLERPTPYLLALAAHSTWMPVNRTVIEKFGPMAQVNSNWTRAGNLVGNGPFTLTEWQANARLVVQRNPAYWDNAQTKLQRVIFFPTENGEVEERNFRAGQVHLTYDLPTTKIAGYREREPAKLRVDPFLRTWYLNFNVTKPPLDQPKVRRALALGIDREAIARRVLDGARVAAHSFVPPGCGDYVSTAKVPGDFVAARQLLAEAGFKGGQGLPVVELQVMTDAFQPKVAEALQEMWRKELGIETRIAPTEKKVWIQNQQSLAHTIGIMGWVADFADPVTFLDLFVSKGGNNWTGWGDATYDGLIAEAARTADPGKRLGIFQKAEALLLEQAPVTPLYFDTRAYLVDPAVKNWEPSPLGLHRYQLIDLQPRP